MNDGARQRAMKLINTYRSLIILIVLALVASILSSNFLSINNLFNVVKQITVAGIVACGMTFVILTGGIDLSVGSILGICAVVSAGVLKSTGNVFLALAVAIVIGIFVGSVNGLFISGFGIPPFISTLGMMTLLQGVILIYTKGTPISIKIKAYKFLGKGSILGVPVPIIILVLVFIIAHYILSYTSFGRKVYAFGGNREAARLSGINIVKTEWMVYAISGFLSGLAAIVFTARLGSAQATSGRGIEMDAIAAVILGGTSLSGGTGFVLPTVVGAMIMGVIDNVLTLMNVNPHATYIVKGAVVIIAVLIDKKVKDLSAKVS